MAEYEEERRQSYIIPDNFDKDGTVSWGSFVISYKQLIGGGVMALPFALIGLFIIAANPSMTMEAKTILMVFLCAVPAIFGAIGYNGDDIFAVIRNFYKWKQNKHSMLYRNTPKIFAKDPLEAYLNRTKTKDMVSQLVMERRNYKQDQKEDISGLVEGQTIEFAESSMDKFYEKGKKKKSARTSASDNQTKTPQKKDVTVQFGDEPDNRSGFIDLTGPDDEEDF